MDGLVDTIPMGLHQYQLQRNGNLIFRGGNLAADRILGINHQALIGKPIEVAFPNLTHTDLPDAYRQIAIDGGVFERELIKYQDERMIGTFKIQAFQTSPGCIAVLFQDMRDMKQTERSLAESEDRYRALVELSPESIIVHSDGKLVYVNPAAVRQMGADRPEQILGMPIMDLLPPETRQLNLEILEQVAQGKPIPPLQQTILRPDGSEAEVEIVGAPVLFQGKQAFQLIVRDITERKLGEKALRVSEHRYRQLFEDAVLGIFQSGPEGKALAVNPMFARIFGYNSPEDALAAIQNVATDIFDDRLRWAEIVRMIQENPEQNTFENTYRRKDYSTFPGTLYLHSVKDTNDRLLYFEGFIEDTSERMRAEARIRDLSKFPAENPNPVGRISREGVLLFANQAAAPLLASFGLQIGQSLPQTWQDYIDQILENRQPKEIETEQDGRIYAFNLIPILNERYVNVYGLDITKRKEAESALQESERQLRSLVEASPLGLHRYELFPDGRLVLTGANPVAERILGIGHQDLLGLNIEDAFPVLRHTQIPALYRQVARGGMPSTCEQIFHWDGQTEEVFEIHAFQTGPFRMAAFFQNVTEKKRAEEALRVSEEKFRTLIEQNSEGVVLFDEKGLIIEWNTAQEYISGILSREALGRPVWDVQFQMLASEQKTPDRYAVMKERGSRILQTGQSPIFNHPVEVLIHRPDGTHALIQQTSFPIKTSLGFRIGSIMRDITDRKKAELDLKRRMVELEALHAVALAGTEAMLMDELLVQVAGIIRAKLYPDHFDVAFLDKEGQFLTFHPSFFTQDTRLVGLQVPLDSGICGAVAHTGIPRRVDDVCLDPNYVNTNADTRSELCVPIIIGGRVVGVINLESAKLSYFTEADERLVTAIAGELGTAIEKIRILEEERNRRKELEALEQISAVLRTVEDKDEILQSVLERMMVALELQGAVLASIDPQTGDLVTELGMGKWVFAKGIHIPQSDGVSRQTATSQRYYLNNDIGEDEKILFHDSLPRLKCLVCLALIVDGQTHGLLYLGRASAFIPKDVHLGIAMADALASALHRIDLHAQTRRHLDRLMALRTIDQSILSRLDMEQTLDVILEKITGLLHVDAANILLYNAQTKTLQVSAERGVSSPLSEDILLPGGSHIGRVTQNLEMVFLPDLSQIKHSPAGKMSQMGEDFVSYAAVPLVAKGELKGVLQIFTNSRLEPSSDWMGFLEALTDQTAIAINSAQLFDEQKQTNARLTKAYEDTIDGWSRALDLRDKETEGHSQRVTDLTLELARRMDISEEQLVHIRRGAKLHDIGKMGIPDSILLKPDKLTQAEWEIMRQHPIFAAALLYPIEFLGPALEIPFGHHEWWDGTGYPLRLKGEEIPLPARIFAVMDVWDALTHDRPYRPAWDKTKALEYIREQSGKHFDPRVVEEFLVMPLDGSIPNPL